MPFGIDAGSGGSYGFGVDVPPQVEDEGAFGGLSIQFESNDVHLGGPDARTVNFSTNLTATRTGDKITVVAAGGGGTSTDVPLLSTVDNPTADNTPIWNSYLGSSGSLVTNRKVVATLGHWGNYTFNGLNDIHPSVSLSIHARGGAVFEAGDDLPETNAQGAPAAMFRALRRAPPSPSVLAFQPAFSSFYLDGNRGGQSFPVYGIRFPNPNPDNNAFDPDPSFNTNKDYVCGRIEFVEIVNCSESGVRAEAGNGRLDVHSARALNCDGDGWELSGNDIVVGGHSAAGGNKRYGFKIGKAAGFLMTTTNVWSNPATRSIESMAVFLFQRLSYSMVCNVFNDAIRLDGGDNGWRGGIIAANSYAIHDDHWVSEGVAVNVNNDGDPRCQAFNTNEGYRTADFAINRLHRTTSVSFPTWQNVGGSLDGGHGTAFNWILDTSGGAASNTIDIVNTGPDCKSWTGLPVTFTASGAVLTSTAHGLPDNARLALHSSSALPAGLSSGVPYFVVGSTANTFGLAHVPGGDAIVTTGAGTGTHQWARLEGTPYNARGNSNINFLLMDSHKGDVRVGTEGAAHPGHFIAGIAKGSSPQNTGVEGDFTVTTIDSRFHCTAHGLALNDPVKFTTTTTLPSGIAVTQMYWVSDVVDANTFEVSDEWDGNSVTLTTTGTGTHTFHSYHRTYGHELGDSTIHDTAPGRNMLWGAWEYQRAPIFNEIAFDKRPATGTISHDVAPYQEAQIFTVTGSGIVGPITVNLPTDLPASWTFPVIFNGGSVDSIVFDVLGSGQFEPNTLAPPTFSPGYLCVIFRYEHLTNQYYVEYNSNEGLQFISTSIANLSIHGGPFIRGFTTAEHIGSLDLVGIDSSGNIVQADAGNGIPAVGVTRKVFESGSTVAAYAKRGIVRNDAWTWTPGQRVWLSHVSSGEFRGSMPTGSAVIQQAVGIALSATMIDFDCTQSWTMV